MLNVVDKDLEIRKKVRMLKGLINVELKKEKLIVVGEVKENDVKVEEVVVVGVCYCLLVFVNEVEILAEN